MNYEPPDPLPKGWTLTNLGKVATHHSGNSKLIKGKLNDAPAKGLFPAYSASGQDVWRDAFEEEGDAIIVSAVGARCGKCFLASDRWSAIANTHVVWPKPEAMDRKFLWYRINDEQFWIRSGTAQPFVVVRKTFERPFALPPFPEQRRIVEEIEKQFTRLEVGVAALRRVQANLKRYRAAVLKAACEGRLVPPIGKIWKSKPLAEFLVAGRAIGYGVLKPGPHIPDGVRLLKSGQVRDGTLDLSDDFRISRELDEEFRRTRLHGGEVLLNLVGASIGRSAIAPTDLRGANVSRAIAVIPVDESFAKWVQLVLSSPPIQSQMMGHRVGNAQPVLNLAHVRRLAIPLPSPTEQTRIVAEVDRRLSVVEELEAVVSANLQRATRLRQSILQQAFAGNL